MSGTLAGWTLPYTVKTVTRTTADFVETESVVTRQVQAVVQVADKNRLSADQIDWSLRYLMVHTSSELANGEYIEFQGEDYKIVDNGDYQLYGFTEATAEQTKRPVIS